MATRVTTKVLYSRLRESILRGAFDPELPISQVQLSRNLGVSRTPLREALRMLQREGLIESEPNRRVRVPLMSIGELEQLYAMRIVLEAFGLRLSFRSLTAEDLRIIDGHRATMETLSGSDVDAWEEAHRAYHEGFTRYAGPRITQLLRQFSDHTLRYRRAYLNEPRAWSAAAGEHRAILAACRAEDLAEATQQLTSHLARTALSLIASLDPAHDPVPVREALRQVAAIRDLLPAGR